MIVLENRHYPFSPLPLPYHFGSLEPYINAATLRIHYTGHYYTYLHKLNNILEQHQELQTLSLPQLLTDTKSLPQSIRIGILQNGGGVYNHELYFLGMTNYLNTGLPRGGFQKALERSFGSLQGMHHAITEYAATIFGSGYLFVVTDQSGALSLTHTSNQDTLLGTSLTPIVTLDLWEHAYYLKHQNKRMDYVESFLHLVNWLYAGTLYESAYSNLNSTGPAL